MIEAKEKHFVLVHGFCHGAWCWYKVVTLLQMKGNRVSALDLAGCGVNPKQLHDISSIFDYVQPLMDFLASLPDDEKVVLVGHSYGGFPIALAMEEFPNKISLAIFVTAYMPNCVDPPASLIHEFFGRSSATSFMDSVFTFDKNLQPVSAVFGPDSMATKLYKNCSAEMLIRPNLFFLEELGRTSLLSEERYGAIRRCYVICEEDQVMDEDFQRYNVENKVPDEVIPIAGAAHMVMLTKPQELCSSLLQLALKYY